MRRIRPSTANRLPAASLVLAGILAGCAPPADQGPPSHPATDESSAAGGPWFEEVGRAAGVDFAMVTGHRPGVYLMPEIKLGGLGLLDYDGDGWLDIFCVQAGSLHADATHRFTHRLLRNLGDWRFEDVTEKAGVGGRGWFGMGCACGDYDNDGDPDIHVTHVQGSLLFRNNGDGTFTDVTEAAGLTVGAWGVSSAWVDYDGDGHLDLVIANYIRWSREAEVDCFAQGGLRDYCSPLSYGAPVMDTLYRNRGDGTFEDVTRPAGFDQAYANGLGVGCADFNRDGLMDIFIANDASPNQLWINQGNGRFKDEAMIRGCAVNLLGTAEANMGVSTLDLNADGWRDLFVTHLVGEANRLFMNTNGFFVDTLQPAGPAVTSWPFTSFGLGFFDFDHDGLLDLFVANGRVKRAATAPDPERPYAEANSLLRGLGALEFEEIPNAGTGHRLIASSRGVAFGDLDNDGDMDLVVVNRDEPYHLLKNVVGHKGHWIMIRLVNRHGSDAIGAEAILEAAGALHHRSVSPHESYASSNDPRIHCGLGSATTVDRVTVRWPDGTTEVFGPLEADRFYEFRQPAATHPSTPGDSAPPSARVAPAR